MTDLSGPKIRNQFDSTQYFEGDTFRSYDLAQNIVDCYPIATTKESDTIYLQNGVVWEDYGEQTLRGELWKILGNAGSTTRINETIEAVKHLSREPRDRLLGLEPHKVAVKHGVVDMLADPDERYEQVYSGPGTFTRVPVEYNEGAFPDDFNNFLFEVLPRDDVSIMWELIGYCLFRDYPFQKAFMFLGDGANGKSTVLAALREFLGTDNIATAELQELADNRFTPAELDGKLANIAPNISSEGLEQTGTFKALTGGDRIRAERKYENAYHFENHAKLIFSANTPPEAEDDTFAYERRWLYFDFPHIFSDDKEDAKDPVPQQELLSQFRDEHAGILNQAFEAFQDLWERGGFEETIFMQEHDDAHERVLNPVVEFVEDELVLDDDCHVRICDVDNAYKIWSKDHGETPQTRETLKREVHREYGPATGKDPDNKRFDVWVGLRLKDDHSDSSAQQTL